MIYCFDIDGTLCDTGSGDYAGARPLPHMTARVRDLHAQGHRIILSTARGSVTGQDWRELTEDQLREWGVPYDELHFGKPYADVYVDDRAEKPRTYWAIVQARMGSKRLPKKSLMDIGGKPLVWHTLDSARKAVGRALLATPDTVLAEYARSQGYPAFIGSEDNVLDRYYQAAKSVGAEHIIRMTADNPMIDPLMVQKLIRFYEDGGYDWAANCRLKVTYPVGNDAEVFSFKVLERAWEAETTPAEQDCVTGYIYAHPELFSLGVMENNKDESHLRWTVDTAEDLENVRRLMCPTRD